MSNYNQKKQKVENQINAENVEQDIENSGKLNQNINAKKVQIGNKPVSCPKCKTSNKRTDKFCKKCGQSLTNLCLTCWTENDLSTVFCTSCGMEVKKTKFGISPELTQKWKEKFTSLGWKSQPIDDITSTLLARMGQPVDSHEVVILSASITGDSYIEKISVTGKDILPDIVFKDKRTGIIIFTNRRTIVKNYVDGWIASYPHEYLSDVTTNQGTRLVDGRTKKGYLNFFLDYKTFGKISIQKFTPSLMEPRGMLARLTSDSSHNARMDLQTTLFNTVMVQKIQESNDDNILFSNFFFSIIEIQNKFQQHKTNYTLGLSFEQFIQDAPEIKLPPDKDSCAPKAAAMLMLMVALVSLVTNWLF